MTLCKRQISHDLSRYAAPTLVAIQPHSSATPCDGSAVWGNRASFSGSLFVSPQLGKLLLPQREGVYYKPALPSRKSSLTVPVPARAGFVVVPLSTVHGAAVPKPIRPAGLFFALVLTLTLGCTTARQTNTARTAREQLLISNAVDQALAKIDFAAFQGSKVFLDDKYLECSDKGYVVGSIRHRLMINGATIAAKAEEADVAMELRSGGVGTDNADSYIGIPAIVLPGMLTLPEVKLITRGQQTALAKIGLVAYDTKTQQLLGAGGVSSSQADDTNLYVLGIGPFQSGTARDELDNTTPRRISQPNQPLPSTVAFQSHGDSGESPGRLQLTGDQRTEKE